MRGSNSKKSQAGQLSEIVTQVEAILANYYQFEPTIEATNHLVGSPDGSTRRGEVLVAVENNETFIGIVFSKDIIQTLELNNPLHYLHSGNLDAFCVIVEEISHAHLIANRASTDLKVSKLELEWQAEIDKLLVCGLILEQQCGRANVVPLARKLYDTATFNVPSGSDEESLYETATRWAARFWWDRLRPMDQPDRVLKCRATRELLCEAYELPWSDKVGVVAGAGQKKAS